MTFFHPYAAPIIPAPPQVIEILTDDDIRKARDLLDELRVYRDTLRGDLRRQKTEFLEEELMLRSMKAADAEVQALEAEYHTAHRSTLAKFLEVARSYTSLSCEVRRYLARK